ncbi:MAG: sugar ABC transporter ATP-binding protein, partial [Tissierellia bacterium]|nr:sugar ABC transporter ATP-binding protein [Tissierellia bacterium]
KGVGLLLDDPIDLNIAFTTLEIKEKFIKKIGPLKMVNKSEIKSHGEQMIKDLDIRCIGPGQDTRYLSGGNQQKECIARALTLEPELLMVSEPTRGIDIGAKNLVLDTLVNLNKEKNTTIIITSSELAELRQIADRIVIISEGKIHAILSPSDSDEKFGLAMAGEDIDKVVG